MQKILDALKLVLSDLQGLSKPAVAATVAGVAAPIIAAVIGVDVTAPVLAADLAAFGAVAALLQKLTASKPAPAPAPDPAPTPAPPAPPLPAKSSAPTQYVALVQQGMVLNQDALAVGIDQAALQAKASAVAKQRNDSQAGFGEGWTAVVVPVGK